MTRPPIVSVQVGAGQVQIVGTYPTIPKKKCAPILPVFNPPVLNPDRFPAVRIPDPKTPANDSKLDALSKQVSDLAALIKGGGLNGKDGRPGKDGLNGSPGPAGPAGEQGLPGKDGSPGAPGPAGKAGVSGRNADVGPLLQRIEALEKSAVNQAAEIAAARKILSGLKGAINIEVSPQR